MGSEKHKDLQSKYVVIIEATHPFKGGGYNCVNSISRVDTVEACTCLHVL